MRNCLFNVNVPLDTQNLVRLNDQKLAESVTNKLLSHPFYLSSRSISIYLSMPKSEIQTEVIVSNALGSNKKVYIPYCPISKRKEREMRMLRLKEGEIELMKPNKWGHKDFTEKEVDGREDGKLASKSDGIG
jgi:5-formyltetrahydrofolate cyclo-ligase